MLVRRLGQSSPLGEQRLGALERIGLKHGHFVSPDGATRSATSGTFGMVSNAPQMTDGYYTAAQNTAGDKTLIYGSPDCYEFLPFGKVASELSGTGSFSGIGSIIHFAQGYGLMGYVQATVPETDVPAGWDAYASFNYITWDGTTAKPLNWFYVYKRSTGDTISSFVTRTNASIRGIRNISGLERFEGSIVSYLGFRTASPRIAPTIRLLAPQGYALWPTPPFDASKTLSSDLPVYILTPQIWILLLRYLEGPPAQPVSMLVTYDAGSSWQAVAVSDAAGLLDSNVLALVSYTNSVCAVHDNSEGFNTIAAFIATTVRNAAATNFTTSLYKLDLNSLHITKLFDYVSRAGAGLNVVMIQSRSGILHIAFDSLNPDNPPKVYASVDYAPDGSSILVPIETGELPVRSRWCGNVFHIDEQTIGLAAYDGEKYVIYETKDTNIQAELGSVWTLRTTVYKGSNVPPPSDFDLGLTHFSDVVHLHQNDEPTYRNAARPWLEDIFYPESV